MIFFITFIRALAACFITNAHYTGVYPTDIIANGGLVGDILFFAVSGYCLYSANKNFPMWYGKRLIRCYLPVIIITVIYLILGYYSLEDKSLFNWLVYPTNYHFVASIVVLYIPYYIVMKTPALRNRLGLIAGIVACGYVIVYIFAFDKSAYHIDYVYSPMIWFLYFESMLLGAWFRQNDDKLRNRFHWGYLLGAVISFCAYFASKLLFSKKAELSNYQIFNQIIIFILLYFVFRTFAGLDSKLEKLPSWIKKIISFLAKITLEIYVVQYALIDLLRPVGHFPLNWFVLTASILIAATALHYICQLILSTGEKLLAKAK